MTQAEPPAGARIMTEGEPGDRFYVIIKGSATVRKRSKVTDASTGQIEEVETDVGALAELMGFGEAALINNAPRNTSVIAKEERRSHDDGPQDLRGGARPAPGDYRQGRACAR